MRKIILSAVAAVALATPALAADMKVKAVAPPVAPYNPWDVAFGAGITSDYIFRGITLSFGPSALDFGAWYYWYPGWQCFNGSVAPVFGTDCLANGYLPVNFN